nr:MAG TPA: hypothetical protein [Caudoviricetes sp.]
MRRPPDRAPLMPAAPLTRSSGRRASLFQPWRP